MKFFPEGIHESRRAQRTGSLARLEKTLPRFLAQTLSLRFDGDHNRCILIKYCRGGGSDKFSYRKTIATH